jgi:enamine deaminase RidA (YjgF/YER057c/UK114 family)
VLKAFGLGLESVVKTVDYVASAALTRYKETERVRRDFLGPVYPAASGVVMPRLLHPDALIQVDVTAARAPAVAVHTGWTQYERLTYSPAVRVGRLLFMSGQGAFDPATESVVFADDIAAQAEYTYQNVLRMVESAGGGPENLVKTIEYVTPTGLPRYRDVAGVRSRLLRQPYPASTGCVCQRLLRPGMLIEVDPLAILSNSV